jgi:hypothetical protein
MDVARGRGMPAPAWPAPAVRMGFSSFRFLRLKQSENNNLWDFFLVLITGSDACHARDCACLFFSD